MNVKDLMLDLDEPGTDDRLDEEDFNDEDLAITAENVDAFADDSVRLYDVVSIHAYREMCDSKDGKRFLAKKQETVKDLSGGHPKSAVVTTSTGSKNFLPSFFAFSSISLQ